MMKRLKTGIVRRLDDLGRIVIPREMRQKLGIREGDAFEIVLDCKGTGFHLVPYRKTDQISVLLDDIDRSEYDCSDEEWAKIRAEKDKIKAAIDKLIEFDV